MTMTIAPNMLGIDNLKAYREAMDVIGTARGISEELIPLDRSDDSIIFSRPSADREASYDWDPSPGKVLVSKLPCPSSTCNWLRYDDTITAELQYSKKDEETTELAHLKALIDGKGEQRTITMDSMLRLQSDSRSDVYTDSLNPGVTYRMMPDGTIFIETEDTKKEA